MKEILYLSNLLYSPKDSLDRMSYAYALLTLICISLVLLIFAYGIGCNIEQDSFLELIPTISYNAIILTTCMHAILVFLNITRKRIAYLKCSDYYIIWVFIPFVKIIFLGLLLIDLPPNDAQN